MDLERMMLKAGITIAGLVTVSLGANGLSDYATARSKAAAQTLIEQKRLEEEAKEEASRMDDYFESLRLKEAERRKAEADTDRRKGNQS